jgi:SAM-dependent methyltransferase
MDLGALYTSAYVDSTYGASGLRHAYERILALDPARSDNVGRVHRIAAFSSEYFDRNGPIPSVLDVGSGLCVFLQRLRSETGWQCTALDPDPRAAAHAREVVGVEALCGDFMSLSGLGRFDVITFNKVLEHVQEPVRMLAKAAEHLTPRGFVYVELPDGEAAAIEGPGREEFFIDHHHVFSMRSMEVLFESAGFHALATERLREPSTKFTLRAFAVPAAARSS